MRADCQWWFLRCEDKTLAGLCKMLLFLFLFMQLSDNMPYYLWYMSAYVAHVGVMLCGRPKPELSAEQRKPDETEAEKNHDYLAEPTDE